MQKFFLVQEIEDAEEEDDSTQVDEEECEDEEGEQEGEDQEEDEDEQLEEDDPEEIEKMRLERLQCRKASAFRGLFRSKGLFWLASRPFVAGQWAQAGTVLVIEGMGPWQSDPEQEVVLIGDFQPSERLAIENELRECLLTNSEMEDFVQERFESFDDPFLPWPMPEITDHTDEDSDESTSKRPRTN
jgi:G3E family GTPase